MKFPHLDGATPFPGDDVHVYEQYVNTFDYITVAAEAEE